MKIIDISVNVQEGMVTWPGDPEVKIDWVARIGEGSDAISARLTMACIPERISMSPCIL